jgi:hypothetical protein
VSGDGGVAALRYCRDVDTPTALVVLYAAAGLLSTLLFALFWYWIVRLAVTHGLRSHSYWLRRQRAASARVDAMNATSTAEIDLPSELR